MSETKQPSPSPVQQICEPCDFEFDEFDLGAVISACQLMGGTLKRVSDFQTKEYQLKFIESPRVHKALLVFFHFQPISTLTREDLDWYESNDFLNVWAKYPEPHQYPDLYQDAVKNKHQNLETYIHLMALPVTKPTNTNTEPWTVGADRLINGHLQPTDALMQAQTPQQFKWLFQRFRFTGRDVALAFHQRPPNLLTLQLFASHSFEMLTIVIKELFATKRWLAMLKMLWSNRDRLRCTSQNHWIFWLAQSLEDKKEPHKDILETLLHTFVLTGILCDIEALTELLKMWPKQAHQIAQIIDQYYFTELSEQFKLCPRVTRKRHGQDKPDNDSVQPLQKKR